MSNGRSLHLALCILSLTVKVLDTIGPCLRFIIDSSLNNGYVPFCFKHERAQSSVQYKICSFQSTKWSVISSRLWKMCCFGSLSSKCSLRHYRLLYFTEMPGAVRWGMVKNFLQLNNLRLKYWFLDVLNVLTSFQNPWFTAFVKAKKKKTFNCNDIWHWYVTTKKAASLYSVHPPINSYWVSIAVLTVHLSRKSSV